MWLPDLAGLLLGICVIASSITALAIFGLRRRPLSSLALFALFAPLSLGVIVLSQDIISYRNLAVEERIASVFVAQHDADTFNLRIDIDGEAMPFRFPVNGDEWRLEGRVLRWDSSLAKLGVQNLVRLERLSGRYHNTTDEAQRHRSVHPLPTRAWVDSWSFLSDYAYVWRYVEADYGSGVYAPLRDGAVFGVYLGRSGLFIRPENPIAIKAMRAWST